MWHYQLSVCPKGVQASELLEKLKKKKKKDYWA